MALGVRRSGQNDSELSVMLDHILEQINNTETFVIGVRRCKSSS